MTEIQKTFREGTFILDLKAHTLRDVFHQVLNFLSAREVLPPEPELREHVEEALLARERQISTSIGHATAVPHAYLDVLTKPVIVFVRLANPLNLGAPDGVPTQFLFVLLGPPDTAAVHLDTLTNIARVVSDDEFRYDVGEAKTQQDLLDAFARFQARTTKPAEPVTEAAVPPELCFTGRFAGGILDDIRRKLPHYASDFRDGFHPKGLAATLFLFFGVLAPTVAFGGLLHDLTNGHIGAIETIAATAIGGALYALFSGQPLTIIASTGPVVIFLGILYSLSESLEVAFLPALGWVGLWTALFTLIIALTDLSLVVRFCTRFTDEIFAALISLIYIVESVGKLSGLVLAPDASHDTSLLSLLLGLGTFFIALSLSRFRRSRYLLPRVREFFADFGPTIAIAAMVIVALQLPSVDLNRLQVPDSFTPTLADRPWLVDLFSVPRWVWWGSALPAVFATVLVFLDQHITVRLVNSGDHRLQKGPGYHLDMGVLAGVMALCAVFGLPWLVAATVRSLNHVRSLATTEEVLSGGETRERIIHVRENRLTGLAISVLIGASLLMLPILKMIPLAALFGLFLYMGVVSIKNNQFFERLSLWLMDPALYPSTHYIRRVSMRTIHLFTLVQLACLAGLWMIKAADSPVVAILFPLLIALLVPVRFVLNRVFATDELAALDAAENPDEEATHWGGG